MDHAYEIDPLTVDFENSPRCTALLFLSSEWQH